MKKDESGTGDLAKPPETARLSMIDGTQQATRPEYWLGAVSVRPGSSDRPAPKAKSFGTRGPYRSCVHPHSLREYRRESLASLLADG